VATIRLLVALGCFSPAVCFSTEVTSDFAAPIASEEVVFQERDGLVAIEAEHFRSQNSKGIRTWMLSTLAGSPDVEPDGDPSHAEAASGGAYLELLPDTRRTHDDKLIKGENFQPSPGEIGRLDYKVHFENPGRYYVWVRAYSTGSEDNGIHVGIDGTWPEHGQRMQWCQGKHQWRWESRQRTAKVHCGVEDEIYLDIDTPGLHTISFCMREDGFEFDRFILTQDRDFQRPNDAGPETLVRSGTLPQAFTAPRGKDGTGQVSILGEQKKWHKTSIELDGPFARELDSDLNPFLDYRMSCLFTHEENPADGSGRQTTFEVPGYFAADGDAANSSSQKGTKWRCHFMPNRTGTWKFQISFVQGKNIAIEPEQRGKPVVGYDGGTGEFIVEGTDKIFPDFRAIGQLRYVGQHFLQAMETGKPFFKVGPDAPETLLAFKDFDDTFARKPKASRVKTWEAHERDWNDGDPTWKQEKGKGLVGAVNYLADKGLNAFSFLTYNVGGDGQNVWPHVSDTDRLHFDCSKLDQWGIVMDHAQSKGLMIHIKLQETENDDRNIGHEGETGNVPAALDGGDLGIERKLYLRELVARFGHAPGLEWNIGEENTQSPEQQNAMIDYLNQIDPYSHPIVLHTYPQEQNQRYDLLLGGQSKLTGASLQNMWDQTHRRTLHWVNASADSGRPWVVANDEQGQADQGVPPDAGYDGFDGVVKMKNDQSYTIDDIRKRTLWGNLMAGGAGVMYYFGYALKQNDLMCEDFRSRDQSWDYCRYTVNFLREQSIPLDRMKNMNSLVGNSSNEYGPWCLAAENEVYLIYSPEGGAVALSTSWKTADCRVLAFNPKTGEGADPDLVSCTDSENGLILKQTDSQPMQDWVFVVRPRERVK
jgi:hypothetical protein